VVIRAAILIALWTAVAGAQPTAATSDVLRQGNTAALAGDWSGVAQLIEPLFHRDLAQPDLGEAHRLAGIAAFFQQQPDAAERHFLAYLRLELDGRLDPALYPPEVVAFFNDVASRHAAELQALKYGLKRSWFLTLLPPLGQLQNGERTKAYVIGGALGALLIVNLTTYYYLRSWCEHTDGRIGGGLSCYDGPSMEKDRNHEAARIRPWNIASGIGVLVVYAYGVYDGVRDYRRHSRELTMQPFVATSSDLGSGTGSGQRVFGVMGSF
jgi:hypothetical protein